MGGSLIFLGGFWGHLIFFVTLIFSPIHDTLLLIKFALQKRKVFVKKNGSFGVIALALGLALLASSCALINSALGGIDPLAGVKASVEKRANAEVASGIGLTGMTRKLMFNIIYSQVFFVGGFNPSLYDLGVGEGAVWRMESMNKDDKKPSVVSSERALLKKNADGSSWWYLSWKTEDEEWAFEALMDNDMMAKKIRYFNADVGRVEEASFDQKVKDKNAESAPPEEAPASDIDIKDLAGIAKGKENVKVGAGSYNADKLVWEWIDEESKDKFSYTWWVDAKAPGGLVKFSALGKDSSLKGELASVKKGYGTKFSSF